MNFIIDNYIKKLTIEDINKFALNNDIVLNRYELDYLYDEIKNNYMKIIYDEAYVINSCNTYLSSENAKKVINLYYDYKKRYKIYL